MADIVERLERMRGIVAERLGPAGLDTLDEVTVEIQRLREELGKDARRVAEVIAEDGGWWSSCSGCHQSDEGVPLGPYNPRFQCHEGAGCGECGGLGVVWNYKFTAADGEAMLAMPNPEDLKRRTDAGEPSREFLRRLVDNVYSWALQDTNYVDFSASDAIVSETRQGLTPERAAVWRSDRLRQAEREGRKDG